LKQESREVPVNVNSRSTLDERNASKNRKIMSATELEGDWRFVVALDGGTSNTRARLMNARGEILATAVRAVGVRNTAISGAPTGRQADLANAVRQVIAETFQRAFTRNLIDSATPRPDAVIAAGMLSSEVGLFAVPHVEAPAGLDDLARAVRVVSLAEVSERPIHFIPGIRTPPGPGPDGWTQADLMRGEEAETFGVIFSLMETGRLNARRQTSPPAFVWPGSHTKLVEIDGDSRIVRSTTSLAGELTQAIWNHTLIAASLPREWPEEIDPDAAESGRRAAERHGLGRAAFLIRIAAVTGGLNPRERASFWIGAVLADDAAFLAKHPILRDAPRRPVWVGGREPLRGLLAGFLQSLHPGEVSALDEKTAETASARGAHLIGVRSSGLGEISSAPPPMEWR
jgi:2-dehydro-3-deoxygalactonokinase